MTSAPPRRVPASAPSSSESGHSTVEVLAWTSALISGLTILVQALTAGLGALACQAAAEHALQVTRVAGGDPAAGQADAVAVLAQVAGRTVRDVNVAATRTPETSNVTVTATAMPVIPVIRIPLRVAVSGPTEPTLVRP